jgi:nitroreductase
MEPKRSSPGFPGFTRRDFLKFLPVAGGALLLAQCDRTPTSPAITSLVPTLSSNRPSILPSQQDTATTASSTPPLIETFTPTPERPGEYLPRVDGSYSSYLLPVPQFRGAMPLMQAFQERHSDREFRTDELPCEQLAAILWAGFGVNRPDGRRTAPSAYNVQDIDIFLATGKGLFRYEAVSHSLAALLPDDLRPFTGIQDFVSTVPLNLIFVSNYNRINASAEDCLQWSWAHSGCISQNVYLACAGLGLATVVRSTLDRTALGMRMGLAASQHITLTQSIGYPL